MSHQNSAVRTGQNADLKIHDGRGKCYVRLRFNFFFIVAGFVCFIGFWFVWFCTLSLYIFSFLASIIIII